MSTRSKSEMSMMVASPNMPSVVCPRYAAHAAGDASAISDCAPLRLSRSRRHRAARHAGPVYHRGVPWRLTEEPFEPAHWERFRSQVRGRIAELLAVGPESIAFTKNTTSGLGLVAVGLDWEAGDNIVGVDREFPANIYPWMGLKRKGVELRLYRA